MRPALFKKLVLNHRLFSIHEVTMKRFYLFFCYSFIVFWGSLAIAFATPIHDNSSGGGAFTCGATGLDNGHRHFFGESPSGRFTGFPGPPGIGKYNLGSAVYALKFDKKAQKSKFQNQHGNMEDDQGFSNPVPSTLFLLGTGMIGLVAFRRKKPDKRIDARRQNPEGRRSKIPAGRNLSVIIKDHAKPSIQHGRA